MLADGFTSRTTQVALQANLDQAIRFCYTVQCEVNSDRSLYLDHRGAAGLDSCATNGCASNSSIGQRPLLIGLLFPETLL